MQSGLVIYASNVSTLSHFYNQVFGLNIRESDDTYAALESEGFELVLLETPVTKSQVASESPLQPRSNTALKPTYFVQDSIDAFRNKIVTHGGHLEAPKNWQFNGQYVCDGWDIEGNIFQIRTPSLS